MIVKQQLFEISAIISQLLEVHAIDRSARAIVQKSSPFVTTLCSRVFGILVQGRWVRRAREYTFPFHIVIGVRKIDKRIYGQVLLLSLLRNRPSDEFHRYYDRLIGRIQIEIVFFIVPFT